MSFSLKLFLRRTAYCRNKSARIITNNSSASSASSQPLLSSARHCRALSHASHVIPKTFKRHLSAAAASINTSDDNNNDHPPFQKILIANRGEITLRIIHTARKLGIQTVAIYSTADAKSLHVQMADEAVCIGPPASSESYLDIDKVYDAIRLTGAEGFHPGYGFLSENALFAERVEELTVGKNNDNESAKVKFIGPSSHAIHSLGDKIQSKLIAKAAGVSVIPGYNGVVTSPEHALEIAHDIGYPVMIKASSGGGGKGMRICYTDDQVKEGYRLGSAEAKSFFGDDRLLVEKYVEDPHHIEIQVLSGKNPQTGELDILCFAERECSIQRRNQKVIEESPSPHLLPETRRKMVREVKSLVREVNYESAGTVEFLVDKHQNYYFLEMNTRLQVEHPVTEMISGDGYTSGNYVDLVRGMLEVAAGRGIPQEYLDMVDHSNEEEEAKDGGEGANVRFTGHAIEARVYAEDPLRGFLPSTGPLVKYVEPPSTLSVEGSDDEDNSCYIRVDTGVVPGSIISPFYDPILSKIISYSPASRHNAIESLGTALDQYLLRGVQHNVPFVRDVLRNDDFVRGYTPTGFIDEHYPDGFSGGQLSEKEKHELAVIAKELFRIREIVMDSPPLASSEEDLSDVMGEKEAKEGVVVCLGGMFGDAYLIETTFGSDGRDAVASVMKLSKDGDIEVGEGNVQLVDLSSIEYEPSSDFAHVVVSGQSRSLQIHEECETGIMKVAMYGSDVDVLVMSRSEYELSRLMKEPIPKDFGNFVMSPMPGTLISFAVKEGDVVEMGQELCVVEAMKMQNVIRSHKGGAVVSKLHGEVGASLRADEILIEFAAE